MSRPAADAALEQYTDELKQRGVSNKQITLARHFLRHLLSTLRELPQDGNGYRHAAETTIRNFPDDASFLETLREFYPYWSGEAHRPAISQPPMVPSAQAVSLTDALSTMEQDPWSQRTINELERQAHQLKSLQRYIDELKRQGLGDDNVMLRTKLIKLLLFTIRDQPQNTDAYRAGVDQTLTLFPHQERWHVFVSLAREFFYFLAGDQDAASRLQKQLSDADLAQLMGA